MRGKPADAKALLDFGCDANALYKQGKTVLFEAIIRGHAHMLALFLVRFPNPVVPEEIVMAAAKYGRQDAQVMKLSRKEVVTVTEGRREDGCKLNRERDYARTAAELMTKFTRSWPTGNDTEEAQHKFRRRYRRGSEAVPDRALGAPDDMLIRLL